MGKKLSETTLEELWKLFPIYLTEHQFSPLTTCLTTCGDFWLILRHLMYLFIIDTLTKLR